MGRLETCPAPTRAEGRRNPISELIVCRPTHRPEPPDAPTWPQCHLYERLASRLAGPRGRRLRSDSRRSSICPPNGGPARSARARHSHREPDRGPSRLACRIKPAASGGESFLKIFRSKNEGRLMEPFGRLTSSMAGRCRRRVRINTILYHYLAQLPVGGRPRPGAPAGERRALQSDEKCKFRLPTTGSCAPAGWAARRTATCLLAAREPTGNELGAGGVWPTKWPIERPAAHS